MINGIEQKKIKKSNQIPEYRLAKMESPFEEQRMDPISLRVVRQNIKNHSQDSRARTAHFRWQFGIILSILDRRQLLIAWACRKSTSAAPDGGPPQSSPRHLTRLSYDVPRQRHRMLSPLSLNIPFRIQPGL